MLAGRDCPVKVEVITPDADPDHGGFGMRVHGLVQMLAQFADVTVTLTSSHGAPPLPRVNYRIEPVFDSFLSRIRRLRTYYKTDFPSRVRTDPPDLIVIEGLDLVGRNQYDEHIPFFLDEHNVEWTVLGYEMDNAPFFRSWLGQRRLVRRLLQPGLKERAMAFERQALQRAAFTLVPSELDRQTIISELPELGTRIHVLPSCLDIERYPVQATEPTNDVVLAANYNYVPNLEAAVFVDKVLAPRLPEARFLLVGPNLPRGFATQANVIQTGYMKDLSQTLASASVCIAPIMKGSGTRLKILSYLAARKAVVATSKACEGLDVVDGEHVLIRDDPTGFRTAIAELLRDRETRNRLGAAGRSLVEAKYHWKVHVESLRRLLMEAIGASRGGSEIPTRAQDVGRAQPRRGKR